MGPSANTNASRTLFEVQEALCVSAFLWIAPPNCFRPTYNAMPARWFPGKGVFVAGIASPALRSPRTATKDTYNDK